jgi:hypothetical protein
MATGWTLLKYKVKLKNTAVATQGCMCPIAR